MSDPSAGRRNVERIYPLSPLQEGMVFESMLEPSSDAYLEQITCRIRGNLDHEAFRSAWAMTLARHSALRTSVHWTAGGNARQVVHRELPLPWVVHDLSHLPATEIDAAVAALWQADRDAGFDLNRPPLMRLTLVRVASDDSRLAWSNHHVVLDGWSRSIVFGQVLDTYDRLTAGQPVVVEPTPQYGDYIAWLGQRDQTADDRFWHDYLQGAVATPLPEDRRSSGRHSSRTLQLSAETTQSLTRFGREHGITVATIVHAAWGLLLARHAAPGRYGDVVFGTTASGRPPTLSGVEQMVGLFINTVPVRLHVDADETVLDWLRQVQSTLLDIREHEHTPLVRVQSGAGVADLINSLVVVENYPLSASQSGGLSITDIRADERTHYPLMLVAAVGPRLELRLVAAPPSGSTDEQAAQSCARLLDQLGHLLTGIAAEPNVPLKQLALDGPEDQRATLALSNPAPGPAADEPALISQFLSQAGQRPDAIAIAGETSCLTYRAVAERAAQLAARLASAGIGRESLVAVLLQRGPRQVIALLAVHLAGAAYLPVDPANPADRLTFLLTDSAIQALVTDTPSYRRLARTTRDSVTAPVLLMDQADQALPVPAAAITPSQLAYVIYTSGSTGRPKGVQITQGNAARLFSATAGWFDFGPSDRWTLFHSVAFDFSVWEMWGALAHGGRLELVPDDARHDPAGFARLLDERAVTVLSQTPSAFLRLAAAHRPEHEALASLRYVVLGGEALHPERLAAWQARYGRNVALVNMYGITETTVHVTGHRIIDADVAGGRSIIGGPIPDLRLYLLDSQLRPLPAGVTGELYVGGAGLARGYRGRPGLSAERFVLDPFHDEPGARMYRTGDLARLRSDGSGFDYVGRGDGQVKLRGYRIELAEIEAALRAAPGVLDAAAVLREDSPGESRIVGYLVAEADFAGADSPPAGTHADAGLPNAGSPEAGSANAESVNAESALVEAALATARARLTTYMLPAAIQVLDRLPLTVNGKLDRAALPAPAAPAATAEWTAPVGPTETRLAAIWQEVLNVPAIDRSANFFALGGHSLLAARAIVRIRAEFATALELRAIFEEPTIAGLAGLLDHATANPSGGGPAATGGERPARIPLTFGQQRIWFFDQWQPGSPVYNITSGLRLAGSLDRPVLQRAFAALLDRHESLRTVFRELDGEAAQVVLPATPPPLPVLDLTGLAGSAQQELVNALAATEATRSFDLAASTPLRVRLLQLSAREHVLLVTVHHIVADGGSLHLLLRELTAFYMAFATGTQPALAPLASQYADYALWQRTSLTEAALQTQVDYWERQLAGAPPVLELPADHPRPATMRYEGSTVAFTVPAEVRLRLEQLTAQTGATTFMTLLAVFQVLLARYSGQQDVVVGTAIEQRPYAQAENLIGLFTNTLVIRSEISDRAAFRQLLDQVRRVCLEAYAHQDVPFEQLVERLRPDRELSHGPLVQVACNYQRLPQAAVEWPGVSVRPLSTAPSPGTTKFDLTLNFFESAEELAGTVEYNTSLFTRPTAERFAAHLLDALHALTAAPDERLGELELLGRDERNQLLTGFARSGSGADPGPEPRLLTELVADHVRTRPDAVALVADEAGVTRHYSYRGLHDRAGGLAAQLQAGGVGAGALVGLHLSRSPEQVIALLAVQRCGAAHVPLDPGYPADRLAFVLDDCRPVLVVTRSAGTLAPTSARVLELDSLDHRDRTEPAAVRLGVESVAYVIYTSGSTGRPKGTLVTHRGLAALSAGQHHSLGAAPGERVLQFASPSFDASVFETVLALTNGATLVLTGGTTSLPGPELLRLLDEHAVTWTVLPPTALTALTGDRPARLPALRMLCTAGEALPPALVEQWSAGREFHNLYGPTETTVIASSGRCWPGRPVTIGRPFAQSTCYVLDARLQPVPVGIPGELYVGGPGVADGYLGRPGLSAERFVPDPFSEVAGRRLYRTGDKVRWTADGELDFLGRLDRQLKLRGFRVEPGEIENLLRRQPGVREATVILREDRPGAPRLVGYVTSVDPDRPAQPETLRVACADELPDYLVPAAVVVLDQLPVGPTGKLDPDALPESDPDAGRAPHEPPRTALEQQLAEIWAAALQRDQISRHDNFFGLGGDSIISIQVVSRARKQGLRIAPKLLFQHPTVAELADALEAARAVTPVTASPATASPVTANPATTVPTAAVPTAAVPTGNQPSADQPPADQPPANQRSAAGTHPIVPTPILRWFLELELPNRNHFNQSIVLRPRTPLVPAQLEAALTALVGHHEVLRMRLVPDGSQSRFEIGDGVPGGILEVVDASMDPRMAAAALPELARRLQQRIDLGRGRLLAAGYLQGPGGDDRLVLVAHHAAVDSVSWRILLDDLDEAGRALAAGTLMILPPVGTSFGQWADRLAAHAKSPSVTTELPHWMSVLAEAAPVPRDAAGPNTFGSTEQVELNLEAELTDTLLRAGDLGRPSELLLTATGRAVAAWAGTPSGFVEVEGHGRAELADDVDLTRTLGWFTSVHPAAVPAGPDPRHDLAEVRAQLAKVHGDGVGYGLLRPALKALLPGPDADVAVNYLGQIDQSFTGESPWQLVAADGGPNVDPNAPRPYLLDVVALVADGRLRLRLTYSRNVHQRGTIQRLAEAIRTGLGQLLGVSAGAEPAGASLPAAAGDQPGTEPQPEPKFEPEPQPEPQPEPKPEPEIAAASSAADSPSADHRRPDLKLRCGPLEEIYPLSPMQTGMLFHALRDPESAEQPYVVQLSGRLTGDLDPSALRRAWQQVVTRHPVLRTSVHWEGLDTPVQAVHPAGEPAWTELDWRALGPDGQGDRVEAFLRADARRGFDLSQAPLVRITLLRLADQEWCLVWTNHHIILDGWSLPILMQELFAGYSARRAGASYQPPAARPFADYIRWLADRDPAEAERFWRARLADLSTATPLPPEPERLDPVASSAHGQHELRLDRDTSERLRTLARTANVTPSTIVAAAWAVVLARHSGERRVTFGYTVSGRPPELADVETMVGMFINTVPVRLDVASGTTVRSWLRKVHAELLDVQEHAYAPLTQLHRYSQVPNGQSLFDTLVVFENYPVDAAVGDHLAGISTEQLSARDQTNFALTLTAAPAAELPLWLSYQRQVYSDRTALRLLQRLGAVLTAIATGAERPVDELEVLAPRERADLVHGWNPPCRVGPDEPSFDRQFQLHARTAPDAIALVEGDRQLSYRALDAAAETLARRLTRQGIGPERRVALVLGRGSAYVVAVLAVARTGGAYVPIDPDYPEQRRALILADADVDLILTADPAADPAGAGAGPLAGIAVLPPTAAAAGPQAAPRSAPDTTRAQVQPANLAYLTYTSGSTGTPKGVQVSRGSLAAAAAAWRADYRLTPADRHLQMANVAFDVCTGDLARAFTSGGVLVLCPKADLLDPQALAHRLDEQAISCAEFVPVVLRYLTDHLLDRRQRLEQLRLLVCGSDAWPSSDYARTRTIGGRHARVLNSYGVTEATIDSMFFEAGDPAIALPTDGLTPVGRPMAHAQVYVLDAAGRPVPPGVVGELTIAGPGVGRGYWRRPGATAERFVPDPFGPPGARAYRSGDRARWNADGQLEFLGRVDEQLKLHGYRIEPGQIESILAAEPGVAATVVTVRPDSAGTPRLVGYVVPADAGHDRDELVARLRAAAESSLPPHEVPAALVVLAELPLTPNGKVDRRALPAPEVPRPGDRVAEDDSEAPATDAETALAQVWEHALGVPRVGLGDDFFALGGDSIISLQVVTRARSAGWSVTPAQVFERRTLRELARVATRFSADRTSIKADQGIVTGVVPLTPIQADFLLSDPPAPQHYNQSVLLRAREAIDLPALEAALQAVLQHHDALRMRFVRDSSPAGWSQQQADGQDRTSPLLRRVDLRELTGPSQHQAVTAVATQTQRSLDLERGPLLAAVHLQLQSDSRLLLVVHHLVVDGVSWRILLEDLQHAYDAAVAGVAVEFCPKTTSFRDWALALAEHAQGTAVAAEADHWLSVARRGADTGLAVDEPDTDEDLQSLLSRANTRTLARELDPAQTTLFLQQVPAAYGARVDELLLAAVAAALGEHLSLDIGGPLLLEVEGHGRDSFRDDLDVARTVGWFTSVHPLLVRADPEPVVTLRSVQQATAEVPGRGLGFGLLRQLRSVDERGAELAELPRAAVSFNYLGQFDQSLQGDGLWSAATEATGPGQDPRAARDYPVEIDAVVLDGRLRVNWTYSHRLHHADTIAAVADTALQHLRTFVASRSEATAWRPARTVVGSTFAVAEIDELLSRIGN